MTHTAGSLLFRRVKQKGKFQVTFLISPLFIMGMQKNGDALSDKSITNYLKEHRRQRKLAFVGPHSASFTLPDRSCGDGGQEHPPNAHAVVNGHQIRFFPDKRPSYRANGQQIRYFPGMRSINRTNGHQIRYLLRKQP